MQKFKTLFLLITLLASFSFGDVWTGDDSKPESTQTVDGKKFYVITTPEELAWIAKQVNAGNNSINAVLANDIVFGKDTASVNTEYAWTPIGKDSAHAFKGILDGAGYSIYGVWTDSTIEYAGLVGVLDSAGVVKNVNMKRDSINANTYAGGVVGYNRGRVSDCANAGTVSAYFYAAGGVVGWNVGTVSGCANEGTVSAYSYAAGGVVGYNRGRVSDCANAGSITASNGYYPNAGGIVGWNVGTVSGCTNEGIVSAYSYAGGIVGWNVGTVSGCANSGSVTGDSYAGGIVGHNGGTVSGCTNEGGVTVTAIDGGSYSYAGGIVGYNHYSTVSDCANEGSVSASYPPFDSHGYVGGIIGYNRGASTRVKNSYSRTDTLAFMGDGEAYRGGVVGVNTDKAQIINCYYDSEKLPDVSAIGSDSATATDVSGMTTAEMQSDQFVLILNTTNGSEENSGLWSRDGGYPIIADVGAASSSSSVAGSSSSASSSSGVANSSSSASSSSSVAGSSSSSGSTALHVAAQPRFNLQVQNRTIWVQNARMGESFAVFDVQGHVLRRGVVNSTELFLSVQNAGAYIVRVGTETMRVRVK